MKLPMNSLEEIAHFLSIHDDFIIVGHEGPDPDSLGSMLGLFFGLRKLGKSCRLVSADPLPPYLTWPGLDQVELLGEEFHPGESTVIVVDCEPSRTGKIAAGVLQAKRLVNIDHHERGRGVGQPRLRRARGGGHQRHYLPPPAKTPGSPDREIATALYGGIVGDTGGSAMPTPTVKFSALPANFWTTAWNRPRWPEIFSMQSLGFLKLLGFALSNLQTAQDGKLVWMAVSHEDFQRFDVDPEMTDHLVSYARMLDRAEVAMVFREVSPGLVRLGLRANAVDVASLARHFGGGGHRLASGATLQGDFQEIVAQVTSTAQRYLLTGELNERHS